MIHHWIFGVSHFEESKPKITKYVMARDLGRATAPAKPRSSEVAVGQNSNNSPTLLFTPNIFQKKG
jgi:hypothetical protein